VVGRAKEVAKYVDPLTTAGLGIAVVPDAVYAHCLEAQASLIRDRVVVIGQSLLLPYLLLVFQAVLAGARDVDLQRLNAALDSCLDSLEAAQDEVEGRLARALIMFENGRSALSATLADAAAALSGVRRLAFELKEGERQPPTPGPADQQAVATGEQSHTELWEDEQA